MNLDEIKRVIKTANVECIDDWQNKKEVLETSIAELLVSFTKSTGLQVDSVTINKIQTLEGITVSYLTEVKIRL